MTLNAKELKYRKESNTNWEPISTVKNSAEGGIKGEYRGSDEHGISESETGESRFGEYLSQAAETAAAMQSVVEVLHEQIVALRSPEKCEQYEFALAGFKKSALTMERLEDRLSHVTAQLAASDLDRRARHPAR